jgi:CDK-activating kinase assembly factor MAT1
MCPVCKTIRYLNKDMEFLINPECYHSMCVNCVNRLFNDGPNQCPYAGCHKTLRRKGFRSAFFGDLSVEREVDIRRRVAAVFNQAEDDFETLRDYNNYLQMVEDLTFDLVSGTDAQRRAAEATLQQWEAEHRADIERNRRAGREADEQSRRRLAAEREAARQRRVEALREAEEEKLERARSREAELDSLAQGEAGAAGGAQRVQLKRRGHAAASRAVEAAVNTAVAAADVGRLSIRGLKEKKKAPAPEGPYDPFGGTDFVPSRYKLRADLAHPALDKYKIDPAHITGGYSFDEYTARAMFEAFAGLGVFIEDEKEVGIGLSAGEVATISAGIAAVGDKMELD